MTHLPKRSTGKIALYWLIFFCVVMLTAEMIFSIFFYQKNGREKLAIVELLKIITKPVSKTSLQYKVQELIRPDSSTEISDRIADDSWKGNIYTYEPWIQFRVADCKTRYMNVSGLERRSVPDEFIQQGGSADSINIFFFGGSTMFGYNVSDAETIPSQFMRIYKKKYPAGKSLRVHNYAIPYYYSSQELFFFSRIIFEGYKPDIVIFLDGLNDFYSPMMLYYDEPFFSSTMRLVFDDGWFQQKHSFLIDTNERLYRNESGIPLDSFCRSLAGKYLKNIEQCRQLADLGGIKSYYFCQPVPFYNYPNQKNDPVCAKNSDERFNRIYPILEKKADSAGNFIFLGNMLQKEKEYPFVDQFHYSPKFSEKIAQRIFLRFENDLIR